MLVVNIRFDTMNTTATEVSQKTTTNSEFYLLIIMIKLTIFMILKVGKTVLHLYSWHNKKVIDKHHNASIARLRKITSRTGDNLEAGLSGQSS